VRDKREAELRRLGVGREGGRKAKRTGRIWVWVVGRMVMPLTKVGCPGGGARLRGRMMSYGLHTLRGFHP
jgi:hypothetical protein